MIDSQQKEILAVLTELIDQDNQYGWLSLVDGYYGGEKRAAYEKRVRRLIAKIKRENPRPPPSVSVGRPRRNMLKKLIV